MPKYKSLRPVSREPDASEDIKDALLAALRDIIYVPLMAMLGQRKGVLRNAASDLRHAIQTGQVQYVNGHFEGTFSASISKELRDMGAKWSRSSSWWTIPQRKLDADIRSAIAASESRFRAMADRVDAHLASMLTTTPEEFLAGASRIQPAKQERIVTDFAKSQAKVQKLIESTVYKSEDEFRANVKNVTVSPTMTTEQKARIAAEYTDTVHLEIADWMQKEITELRRKVRDQSHAGVRYGSLVDEVQKSYGVARSKARFIARQETSLLMTKLAQVRYQSAGVNEYRWQCVAGSPAHPVRPGHKALDGKVFRWDDPPIVDEKGNRKNPGQDYNCRCRAIPVVRF